MTNSIFNSNYSSSNPFSMSQRGNSNSQEDSLMQAYARLEALKQKQQPQYMQPQSTVFSDIAFEFKDLPEDEIEFIANSEEYQTLNAKYQNEFSQFLINKFSNEYLQSGNCKTLEEMLAVIRQQKTKYQKKFASDIDEIRGQNKTLLDRNNELAESNLKLQEELRKIQERLANNE